MFCKLPAWDCFPPQANILCSYTLLVFQGVYKTTALGRKDDNRDLDLTESQIRRDIYKLQVLYLQRKGNNIDFNSS